MGYNPRLCWRSLDQPYAVKWRNWQAAFKELDTSKRFLGLAKSSEACHLALPAMVLPRLDTREYLRITTTMNDTVPLHIPFAALADFCRRYQVRELALFGSMLRQEPRPDSDVDLLVSFAPAARVTFLTLARMQRELEALLGRKVDLVPKDGLKPVIREHILATARVLYAA